MSCLSKIVIKIFQAIVAFLVIFRSAAWPQEPALYKNLLPDLQNLTFTESTTSSSMTGYADKISVMPGDTLHFKTSTSAASFSVSVKRFGQHAVTVLEINDLSGKQQAIPDSAWKYGCGWETSFSLVIPDSFRTGMYSALLRDRNNKAMWVTFIVKPASKGRVPLAVLASTNTWQAYNAWGGKSFYIPKDDYAKYLTYARPNTRDYPVGTGINHLTRAELWILSWLEQNGYDYDLYSDVDMHADSTLLDNYQTLILNTHPEYWSGQMMDHLDDFLNRGGNLLYLGGNGLYWKVTFDSTNTVMECRKDGTIHTQTGEKGGLWQNLGRSQAKILGVRYSGAGYNTWSYFTVKQASHWVFQGTGYNNGEIFGALGYNGGGASGWEMDKIDPEYSPSNVVLLAKGGNPDNSGAEMTYYDHPGGGFVFSASSISFGGTLIRTDGKYMKLTKLVSNVLNGRPTGIAEPTNPSPRSYQLYQNYPNPFNPETTITFVLPRDQHVTLKIYDSLGREVGVLVNRQVGAGTYKVQFNGENLPGGIYIYKIETGTFSKAKKMLLLK